MKRTIHGDPGSALEGLRGMGPGPGRGRTVITPHIRAARALGVPLRTLEETATQLLAQDGQRVISVVERQMLLADILNRELNREEGAGSVIDPRGAAARLRVGVETLLRGAEAPAQALEGEEAKQLVELGGVIARYQAALAQEKLVDPAEALWRAARLVTRPIPLLVWGYFVPRADELTFLDVLAGDGSHLIFPFGPEPILAKNRRWVAWLEARGWVAEGETREAPRPTARLVGWRTAQQFWRGEQGEEPTRGELWSEATVEEEVRTVLGEVKRLLVEGVSAREMVLVTNEEAIYVPKLRAIAREYGVPVRLPNQRPLGESLFGAWLRVALRAIRENLPFEATLATLAHRAGPGLAAEPLRQLLEKHPIGETEWRNGLEAALAPTQEAEPPLQDWVSALHWPREASRAEYTGRLIALLDLRRTSSLASSTLGEEPGEREFRWQLTASEVGAPGQSIPLGQQLDQWLDLLSILSLPADSDPAGPTGVEIHRPESLGGAAYRQVFVLGMMEGSLPASPREDSLLDFHTRKRLAERGIELGSAIEEVRRQALTFSCVLGTATERIVFSLTRQKEREATIRSPYLDRLGLEERRVDRVIASPEEARRRFSESAPDWGPDALLPAIRHALAVERRRLSPLPPDSYDGVPGVPLRDFEDHRWSASQLISMGTCAFQWFVRYGLGAGESLEPEEEISQRMLGTLYHKALELSLNSLPTGVDPRAYALERLEASFLDAERAVGLPQLPAQLSTWPVRRREHLDILTRVIRADDFLAPEATVVGQEVRFRGEFHGLRVTGVIDRIDRLPTSPGEKRRLLFLDYKTGGSPSLGIQNEAGEAAVDLQIPLYQIAAGPTLYPGSEIEGAYFSINGAKRIENPAPPPDGWHEAFAREVLARVREGRFPVAPDVGRKACGRCQFAAICRIGPRLARKESAQKRGTDA